MVLASSLYGKIKYFRAHQNVHKWANAGRFTQTTTTLRYSTRFLILNNLRKILDTLSSRALVNKWHRQRQWQYSTYLGNLGQQTHIKAIKPCLHWQRLWDNTGDSDSHHILALETLGDATQIGLFLFLVVLPKVAKTRTVTSPKATIACRCRQRFR